MNNEDSGHDVEMAMLENSLTFFGAITASVSHELNNVVSIIDQNNGLMDDLLIGALNGREISNERLQRISDSISNQIERGVKIIKRLNSFAHSVDEPKKQFDLINLIDNFMRLAERLAILRKAGLESIHKEPAIVLKSSPFLVQQILFKCIQRCLVSTQPGDTISIESKIEGNDVHILVTGRCTESVTEGWDSDYIDQLLKLINSTLKIQCEGEFETMEVVLKDSL